MEENFEKDFEKIKEQDLNPEVTRKYLLLIKRFINEIKLAYEDEWISKEEIKNIFEEEYKEGFKKECEADRIYMFIKKYNICHRLLEQSKGNKNEYNRKMNLVRKLDDSSLEKCADRDELSALRYVIGKKNTIGNTYKSEIELLKEEEQKNLKIAKGIMINIIEKSVKYLEKFGILDSDIEESNRILEELNLENLKYIKSNELSNDNVEVIPDGIILPFKDKDGNEIDYSKDNDSINAENEDIGVIDSLSKENLEKLSVDELLVVTTFLESKVAEEIVEISKARTVINYLGLWDDLVEKEEDFVEKISSDDIKLGIKKDTAITYLARSECEISDNLLEKYIRFLEIPQEISKDKKGLRIKNIIKEYKNKKEDFKAKKEEIKNEVNDMREEIITFSNTVTDVMTLECSIIEKLYNKTFKPKVKWGIVEEIEQSDYEKEQYYTIAMENYNFRGPLVMTILKDRAHRFLGKEKLDFPTFKGNLNVKYGDIMSKLYLSKSKKFKEEAKKKYEEDPTNPLYASIADKKVKKHKKIEEEGR